jgi:hypothetical protein
MGALHFVPMHPPLPLWGISPSRGEIGRCPVKPHQNPLFSLLRNKERTISPLEGEMSALLTEGGEHTSIQFKIMAMGASQ